MPRRLPVNMYCHQVCEGSCLPDAQDEDTADAFQKLQLITWAEHLPVLLYRTTLPASLLPSSWSSPAYRYTPWAMTGLMLW